MIGFALIALGITYGIASASLTAPVRIFMVELSGRNHYLITLLYCHACMGFWVGAALGSAGLWPEPVYGFAAAWRAAFATAALGALWSAYGPQTSMHFELGIPDPDDEKPLSTPPPKETP
jgi:hypothetical protein